MSNKISNTDVFENMPVSKAVMTMAVPTIMGQLIILFYNMADTYFLGKTNNPYMVAAAALILPIYNIAISIAGISGVGGGALVSRCLGKGEKKEARRVSTFSLYMSFGFALLFSLSMLLFTRPILTYLGVDQDTYSYARVYAICVIVIGGIPTILSNTLSNLIRSIGESKKAGFGVTFGGLLNIVLDPLFMFVIMPQGMEIAGAGLATGLSNLCSCIYFFGVIRSLGKDSVLYSIVLDKLPTKDSFVSIFSVGIPSAIAGFLFDYNSIVIGRLMTSYGAIEMAAMGIVLKAERLPLNIGVGICQGMMPLVGYSYAQKNLKRTRDIASFSRMAGILCALVSIVLYEVFAPYIMSFFIKDALTVSLGTCFLRARCLATPLMILSFFHVYMFNGFGEGKIALFLGVMRWAAFNIPMLYIMNHLFGMMGIVWSQIIADIFTVSLSVYVYVRFMKKVETNAESEG